MIMRLRGKIKDISTTVNGETTVTLAIEDGEAATPGLVELYRDGSQLSVELKKYRKKRSLDANALMWACLEEIAAALRTDKWSVYLRMLRRYGKFTYICVKPQAVEAMKEMWRECEEIGTIEINGQEAVQLLCYFGSSTYDTKEFSRLLDGIIDEMKEMKLQPPLPREVREAMKVWERGHRKNEPEKESAEDENRVD